MELTSTPAISPEKMDFRAYSISWNLTKRCNLNCDHCYLDAEFRGGLKTDELNTEECFRVIDQIAEVNPNAFLILTGGEPLLRPDIYDIIRYAADKKFMVVLGTNGTMINRVNAEKIKAAGAHGVGISIDSMNPDKHNKFRGVEKAWEHSMEAFDILNEVGVDFLVQMSVSDMNYKEIPDVVEFTEKIGAIAFNLYFLVCTGRGQGNTDISNAAYEEALKMLREEGLENTYARHARLGEATRRAVAAWGLENFCNDPKAVSSAATSVLMPEGSDANLVRTICLEKFDMSLGGGLGQIDGKVFRIGHLGDVNDLMICGTLSGVEMALGIAGVPHKSGGVVAALEYLARN